MSYQKGSDMLLKVDVDGLGTYSTVAAMRTKSLRLNNQLVDVTNQDSANKWREGLAGAGIKSLQASARGVFNDAASENTVLSYLINGTNRNWQCVIPTLGTFTFQGQVTQLEYDGEHDKEVQYNLSLDSTGQLTYAGL
jgi:TP901-1 family phage major tail protein